MLETDARCKASVTPSELGRLFAFLGFRSFSQSRQFLILSSDPSVRNLKFLAGNVITDGDINSVAQHLTKKLSMALYALGTL